MRLKIYEAGHPVPDKNGVRGTEDIIKLLKDAREDSSIFWVAAIRGLLC
jgi:glycerate-2-kinase